MSSTEPRPAEFMRADAVRNAQRIVEVAARLLGDDPQVGMGEVAAAAEISRATVYRHFATREALINAIRRQAAVQGELALARCRLDEGSAVEALERLVRAWLDLAERFSFPQLAAQPEPHASPEEREQLRGVFTGPLLALIERGQASGEFSTELLPAWGARAFSGILLAGARAVSDGVVSRRAAPELVVRTVLEGLRG